MTQPIDLKAMHYDSCTEESAIAWIKEVVTDLVSDDFQFHETGMVVRLGVDEFLRADFGDTILLHKGKFTTDPSFIFKENHE